MWVEKSARVVWREGWRGEWVWGVVEVRCSVSVVGVWWLGAEGVSWDEMCCKAHTVGAKCKTEHKYK